MAKRKSKTKMLPKLNPQDPHRSDFLSGTFVIAGLTVVALVILVFTISKIPYRVDPDLPIPTLDSIDAYTNNETVDITGDGVPGEKIVLYINGKLQTKTATVDKYGTFQFSDVSATQEGEYKYEVATVQGSILKKRSELSNKAVVIVDRTSPSKDIEFFYPEETDIDEAIISGIAERKSYIILKREEDIYETKTDNEGKFEFSNIPLKEGKNTFFVSIKDEAGNEVTLSNNVIVAYTPGEVNGDGASSELPESAGELEKALDVILNQKLMLILGVLSIAAFAGSSIIVYKKKNL